VGNYAFQVNWTDGHTSGIFTFDYLRKLAEVTNAPSGPASAEDGSAGEEESSGGGGCGSHGSGCSH